MPLPVRYKSHRITVEAPFVMSLTSHTELAGGVWLHRLLPVRLLYGWLVCILRNSKYVVIFAVTDRGNAGPGDKQRANGERYDSVHLPKLRKLASKTVASQWKMLTRQ